jgi:hypothetical protein
VRPLAIDLFCGLGGWTEGLLAEGYDVVGFDIERRPYPAQLVLQDVLTLHGSQFKDAALIVASPPCQFFSYIAMPWTRAKLLGAVTRLCPLRIAKELELFKACFRIQREASEAAGHHIPLVLENVRGAQPWVGPAKWNYGSFYLWGDVPALMPTTFKGLKVPGFRFDGSGGSFQTASVELVGIKGSVGSERRHPNALGWKIPSTSSHSPARKQASAEIAKIPFPLARHIASVYREQYERSL